MTYQYILRFGVQPGFHEDKKLEQLIAFCKDAKIDDVAFHVNQSALTQGHLSKEETAPWMEVISKGKHLLDTIGVKTSINPNITTMHSDGGLELRPGQKFTLMVDPYGKQATTQVCPLCAEWRRYITEMYAYYATLEPYMLWVEDDFRLHNHVPLEWGGCFCDLHMEEFSRRAGRKLGREEFVQGLLQPGEPHPFRQIWLDTGSESMAELARLIGNAVHEVSPSTRVGLMSSMPEVHCAEGRDWQGILGGLAGPETPMVDRPNLPMYSERAPSEYLWDFVAASRLTQAMSPVSTELYPELESSPYSRFAKSLTSTCFQIESSLSLLPKGITLNMECMIGNGIMVREGYEIALADAKDLAQTVSDLGLRQTDEAGINVLVSSKSSYSLYTSQGSAMEELYPRETFWASLLSCFGMANKYCVDEIPSNSVAAVSGQYLRNLGEDELKRLFSSNFILMDGEAAFTLFDMGYGELAGIRSAVLRKQDSGFQAYEQICDGKMYAGLDEARIVLQWSAGDFLEIEYSGAMVIKSMAKNAFGQDVGPGMSVYAGRCFILPYVPHADAGVLCRHLSPIRQEVVQSVLQEYATASCPIFVRNDPYVTVNVYNTDDRTVLLLTNWSLDNLDQVRICAPGLSAGGSRELNSRYGAINADLTREDDDIVLLSGLASMETKAITMTRRSQELECSSLRDSDLRESSPQLAFQR